jgi:hypothetical protein
LSGFARSLILQGEESPKMPKLKIQKVPVSKRAVIQRINRHIAADGLVLKSMRGRGKSSYFVLNTETSMVEFVEPEAYARRLHLLGDWEEVDETRVVDR